MLKIVNEVLQWLGIAYCIVYIQLQGRSMVGLASALNDLVDLLITKEKRKENEL